MGSNEGTRERAVQNVVTKRVVIAALPQTYFTVTIFFLTQNGFPRVLSLLEFYLLGCENKLLLLVWFLDYSAEVENYY